MIETRCVRHIVTYVYIISEKRHKTIEAAPVDRSLKLAPFLHSTGLSETTLHSSCNNKCIFKQCLLKW